MSETKTTREFRTTCLGSAAFLLHVLSEDRFLGAEQIGKGVFFVFDDTDTKDGMDCTYLKRLFQSKESAQVRNAREFSDDHRTMARTMSEARRMPGERIKI